MKPLKLVTQNKELLQQRVKEQKEYDHLFSQNFDIPKHLVKEKPKKKPKVVSNAAAPQQLGLHLGTASLNKLSSALRFFQELGIIKHPYMCVSAKRALGQRAQHDRDTASTL